MNKFFYSLIICTLIYSCTYDNQGLNTQDFYTSNMYKNIETGMTYQRVSQIMGDNGRLDFEATNPGIDGFTKETVDKVYTWTNPNGSSITITFEDGKVFQKMQSGLN